MQLTTLLAAPLCGALCALGNAAQEPAVPAGNGAAAPSPTAATLWWGDYDGDGLLDAFALKSDGTGQLLRNAGDGSFQDVPAGTSGLVAASASTGQVTTAAWSDFDGDGWIDLYLGKAGGPGHLYRNLGGGTFSDITAGAGIDHDGAARNAWWMDYDQDGRIDLFIETTSASGVYHNLGAALFERVELPFVATSPGFDAPADAGASADASGSGGSGGATVLGIGGDSSSVSSGAGGARGLGSGGRAVVNAGGLPSTTINNPGVSAGQPATSPALLCIETIRDQATNMCINASSDPTLGMLCPLGNDFYIESSSGAIGMGTITPTASLHIVDAAPGANLLLDRPGGAQVSLTANAVTGSVGTQNSQDFRLLTNNSVRVSIDTTGDVGIGDTTPDGKLEVRQNGTEDIFNLYDSGTNVLTVVDGGNLGLGIAAPSERVHVFDAANEPTLQLESPINAVDAGRLFLTEGSSLGGYLRYDGGANQMHLGMLNGAGSQIDGLSMSRTSGKIGIHGAPGSAWLTLSENSTDTVLRSESTAGLAASFESNGGGSFSPAVEIKHNGMATALEVTHSLLGGAGKFQVTNTSSTASALSADHDGGGAAGFFSASSTTSLTPALWVSAFSNNAPGFQATSNNSGDAGFFFCNDTAGTGKGVNVRVRGSGDGVYSSAEGGGYGGFFEATTSSGVALRANNTTNIGNIIEAANSTDIEFRVDSGGNTYTDLAFIGSGADYAEWLERSNPDEDLSPGDVVGVRGGKVSKSLAGAQQFLVISTNPALVGNALGAESDGREGFEICAFVGQVPVRVLGAVAVGDFLVPSGREDGTARAVAPDRLRADQLGSVLGRAWEASALETEKLVNVVVGIDEGAAAAVVIESLRGAVSARDGQLAGLSGRLALVEEALGLASSGSGASGAVAER